MAPRSGVQPPMRAYNNPEYRAMAPGDPNMSLADVLHLRLSGAGGDARTHNLNRYTTNIGQR